MRMRDDKILVKMDTPAEVSKGGIIMPATKEKQTMGTVKAVGPGVWQDGARRPVDVEAGDRVLMSKYSGTDIKLGNEELRIVDAGEIYAVLEKGDEK